MELMKGAEAPPLPETERCGGAFRGGGAPGGRGKSGNPRNGGIT